MSKLAPDHRHQLAFGQHEARGDQPLVGLGGDRRRTEGGAQDGGFQHAGQAGDVAGGEEIVAHETLHAVLAAVAGVAHACADHRLQVEGQALLGAAGDVVQVEAQCPEKFPRPARVARFHRRQHAGDVGELAHGVGFEHVAGDPVERLQVAQTAAAFLDIRFDHERAVAEAAMARLAFGLLGGDVFGRAGGLAGGAEALMEILEQRRVAGERAGVEQRGTDGDVLGAFAQAFLDRAGGVADLQPEVPEEIEHVFDHRERMRGRLVRGQEQQVDVAERRQGAAAVAAGGGDAQGLDPAERGGGVGKECAHQPVRQFGELVAGLQAGDLPLFEGFAHLRLDAREVAAEGSECRLARRRPVRLRQGCQGFGQRNGGAGGRRFGSVGQHLVMLTRQCRRRKPVATI